MNSNNGPSQRQIRFSEVIRKIISDTIKKNHILSDEIELGSVTVSFVQLSKDLRVASVYFTPLGGKNKDQILQFLNNNKYVFQKSISNAKLRSKFTPKINFYIDDSFDEAEKIENLLLDQKVLRDLDNE